MNGKGVRYTWPEVWEFGQTFGILAIELKQLAGAIEVHVRAHPIEYPRSTLYPVPVADAPSGQ